MVFTGHVVGGTFGGQAGTGLVGPPGPQGVPGPPGAQGVPGLPGVTDTYTRSEINEAIGSQVQGLLNIVPTYQELQQGLAEKADASNVYTKSETDTLLAGKVSSATLSSSIATLDLAKADRQSTYTKTEVDSAFAATTNAIANATFTRDQTRQLLQLNSVGGHEYVISQTNLAPWTVAQVTQEQFFTDIIGQRISLETSAYLGMTSLRPLYTLRVEMHARLVGVSQLAISATDGLSWNSVAGSQMITSLDASAFKLIRHDMQVPQNGVLNLHVGVHENSDIDQQPIAAGAYLDVFAFRIFYRGIESLWSNVVELTQQVTVPPLRAISFFGAPTLHDNGGCKWGGIRSSTSI